jgi:hypothetical protein
LEPEIDHFVIAITAPEAAARHSEPFQLMTNSKGLSTAEFVDYTFVFN